MKIKLTINVSVEKKHGMTEGRIFDVFREQEQDRKQSGGWWVIGDAGEEIKILGHEAEVVQT